MFFPNSEVKVLIYYMDFSRKQRNHYSFYEQRHGKKEYSLLSASVFQLQLPAAPEDQAIITTCPTKEVNAFSWPQ